MPGNNPGTINLPSQPWGRSFLLNNNAGEGLDDLAFTAYTKTLPPAASALALKPLLRLDHVIDVRDYGALGDCRNAADGVATAGDATFTSATAAWVAGDVGKAIVIPGAGVAGATLVTTIAVINGLSSIELTVAATTSVNPAVYTYGTDDTVALTAAIAAAYAGRLPLYLRAGLYLFTDTLALDLPIVVIGDGIAASVLIPALDMTRDAVTVGSALATGRNGWLLMDFSIVGREGSCRDAMRMTYMSRADFRNICIFTGTAPTGFAMRFVGCIYGKFEDITCRINPLAPDYDPTYTFGVLPANGIGLETYCSSRGEDGVAVAGDATFTAASGITALAGQYFVVQGAGPGGSDLLTTVASVTTPTEIELTVAPSTSVPAARWYGNGINQCNGLTFYVYLSGFAGDAFRVDHQFNAGDMHVSGIIENTTGYALDLHGCRGGTYQDLHMEAGTPHIRLTNCDTVMLGPTFVDPSGDLALLSCSCVEIDNASFAAVNIDAYSYSTVLGQIRGLWAAGAFVDNGINTIDGGKVQTANLPNNQAHAGEYHDRENLFQNGSFEDWRGTDRPYGWDKPGGWTWTKCGNGLADTRKLFGRYCAKAVCGANYASYAFAADARFTNQRITLSYWVYTPTQAEATGPVPRLAVNGHYYYPDTGTYYIRDAWRKVSITGFVAAGEEALVSFEIGGVALASGFYVSGMCLFVGQQGTRGWVAPQGELQGDMIVTGDYRVADSVVVADNAAWATWVPVVTANGAMTIANLVVNRAAYKALGKSVHVAVNLTLDLGGVADADIYVTAPTVAPPLTSLTYQLALVGPGSGAVQLSLVHTDTVHGFTLHRYSGANFTLGNALGLVFTFTYERS